MTLFYNVGLLNCELFATSIVMAISIVIIIINYLVNIIINYYGPSF